MSQRNQQMLSDFECEKLDQRAEERAEDNWEAEQYFLDIEYYGWEQW